MGKTSAVIRLGYVHLRVTDLEEARNHYSNTLGMEVVHEEPGKLWLKCWDEWDHHSLVLEEGGVGLVKFGYKVETGDDLATFENRAQQFGVTTGRFAAGENLKVGEGLRLTLPSEHTIELQEGDRLRKVLGFAYPNAAPPPPGGSAPNPTTRNDRKERMTWA